MSLHQNASKIRTQGKINNSISNLGHFILPCILFAENYFVAEMMLIGSVFMLTGPSGSRKSDLCKQLLENAAKMMVLPPIECIFNFCWWQELYEQIKIPCPIKFMKVISKFEELPKDRQPQILIVDDSMDEVANSPDVADMHTKYSQHYN